MLITYILPHFYCTIIPHFLGRHLSFVTTSMAWSSIKASERAIVGQLERLFSQVLKKNTPQIWKSFYCLTIFFSSLTESNTLGLILLWIRLGEVYMDVGWDV